MEFLHLPVEIRFEIYSKLLVLNEPIVLLFTGYQFVARVDAEGLGFCLALLRVCKQVYSEAVAVLYSNNFFQLYHPFNTVLDQTKIITAITQQIGDRTSLLRYVGIGIPTAPNGRYDDPRNGARKHTSDTLKKFHEMHLVGLGMLSDAFSGITTLELSISSERNDMVFCNLVSFTELLDMIQAKLDGFRSLRKVKVDFILFDWDSDDEDNNREQAGEDDEDEDSRDDRRSAYQNSIKQLCSRGWTVQITKEPPVKDLDTDEDDRYDMNDDNFGFEPDYYDTWNSDDYYRRLHDPNNADDGGPA